MTLRKSSSSLGGEVLPARISRRIGIDKIMLPSLIFLPLLNAFTLNERTDRIKDTRRDDFFGDPFAAQGHGLLEIAFFDATSG